MKKTILSLILALCLCVSASFAAAAGLAGLRGDAVVAADGLPDPALAMEGVYATLLQKDYQFSESYICTAYTYPMPRSMQSFLNDYQEIAARSGYSVESQTIDGTQGYIVRDGGGLYAMLIPYFENKLLFLVHNGMDFALAERQNYMTITYNGEDYTFTGISGRINAEALNTYSMIFQNDDTLNDRELSQLTIEIPTDVAAGTELYVHGKLIIKGFYMWMNTYEKLVMDYLTHYGNRRDAIDNAKDYALLTVTEKTVTSDGTLIKGKFEGRFSSGQKVFENGQFSILCIDWPL